METADKPSPEAIPRFPMTSDELDKAAAKAMSEALLSEQNRWNIPFITWRNNRVVSVKP